MMRNATQTAATHPVVPIQQSSPPATRLTEPHRRLMAAVLQAVVDDCRGGSDRRRRAGLPAIAGSSIRKATAYVRSRDRVWPFSFENLCEALDVDAAALRAEIGVPPVPRMKVLGSIRSQPT